MTPGAPHWEDLRVRYERQKVDLGHAQLLCTRIVGARSDADIATHLEEYRTVLVEARERGHKLVDILDIRQASVPTATQRRMQGDWNTKHEELMRQTLVGFTFVVSSTVMRGVITAITWIRPLPFPTAVFTELDQAVQWGIERLRDSGIPISVADCDEARRVLAHQDLADMTARR